MSEIKKSIGFNLLRIFRYLQVIKLELFVNNKWINSDVINNGLFLYVKSEILDVSQMKDGCDHIENDNLERYNIIDKLLIVPCFDT